LASVSSPRSSAVNQSSITIHYYTLSSSEHSKVSTIEELWIVTDLDGIVANLIAEIDSTLLFLSAANRKLREVSRSCMSFLRRTVWNSSCLHLGLARYVHVIEMYAASMNRKIYVLTSLECTVEAAVIIIAPMKAT
jgi:hypothetical protein